MEANKKILDFFNEAGMFFYASVDNGQARVRPFGFAMEYEDKLYFGMGSHKASYRETMENPYIEVCACKGGAFLRVRGKAIEDMRPEVQSHMFEVSPFLKNIYNEESGLVHATVYLEDMEAVLFDMNGSQEKWA